MEFVSGLSAKSVLADLHSGERSNHLDVDGTALLRIGTDVRGSIRASQIATGEENNLSISIYYLYLYLYTYIHIYLNIHIFIYLYINIHIYGLQP